MPAIRRFSGLLWVALSLPAVTDAHIDPVTGQDYNGFERNDGLGSCCDWHDCRPASAPFMEPDGEKMMDRGGNKFAFDPSKVVRRPSDDGNWHICANAVRLNCIIAPAEGMRSPLSGEPRFSQSLDRAPDDTWLHPLSPVEIARQLSSAAICTAPGR